MNIGNQQIGAFLDSLAAKEPIPGGGAISGVVAALATSLGNMVLAYTDGKKKYALHAPLHTDCEHFLKAARIEAMELADADTDAYASLDSLWKLDKNDPRRKEHWDDAVEQVVGIPIRTMELCKQVLHTLETMVGKTNNMLVSDLATASILSNTSAEIAAWTARINLPLVDDKARKSELEEKIQSLLTTCGSIAQVIDEACRNV